MKRMRTIGMGMLVITLACMAVHLWVTPLPDWAVRLNGVVMILAIFVTVFSAVRLRMTR